ncbi:universal stress protein [Geodermatophilus sp. SYSU D00758]
MTDAGAPPRPDGARPRVVVGVDGSPPARAALVTALAEAADRGAALEVVACYAGELYRMTSTVATAPDLAGLREDTGARARELVADARGDAALEAVPGAGDVLVDVVASPEPAADELVARSAGADLLVVGNRGRGAVRSALLGSVALHCVTAARCPVLVVHGTPVQRTAPGPVVVGVDGSPASRAALAAAVDQAARIGAAVEVLATFSLDDAWSDLWTVVLPPVDQVYGQVLRRTRAVVDEVLSGRTDVPDVRVLAEEGPAGELLVRRAREASVLVVGGRGHSTLRGLLVGSVALHCALAAPCPVLVVHPPDRAAAAPDRAGALAAAR